MFNLEDITARHNAEDVRKRFETGWHEHDRRTLEDFLSLFDALDAASVRLRELESMKCETCGEREEARPYYYNPDHLGFCRQLILRVGLPPDFGCNQWTPPKEATP